MEGEVDAISQRAAALVQRFGPLMLEAQMGSEPDAAAIRRLAVEMRETADMWRVALGRMRLTQDFQGLEFYKFTEAMLARQGMTMELAQAFMAWQMEGMLASCERRPPPPPPAGLPQEILANMLSGSAPNPSMMGPPGGANPITTWPFDSDSDALKSDLVSDEFDRLRRDHAQLITMGEGYGAFDSAGKIMFLDQLQAVEGRWEVFMMRFRLLGQLNPQYQRETELYLQQLGLTPTEFGELLRAAHQTMRRDAEQEALAR